MKKANIPIFYACDDNFAKYTAVSITSLRKHASKFYEYDIYILNAGLSGQTKTMFKNLENDEIKVIFIDVSDYLLNVSEKLPLRDYYSRTTYYRMFIAEMFPEFNKAIYIDSDTIVKTDISNLYYTDIGDSFVGACHEQVMIQIDTFGTYVEKALGLSRYSFFNAGILLINCEEFRLHFVLDKFIYYLRLYNFVVTQDEDYLNVICKDHVFWLNQRWNTQTLDQIPFPIDEARIIHYCLYNKPWHYKDTKHGDIFWKYAKETEVYDILMEELEAYSDEQKKKDAEGAENLLKLAENETDKDDNFLNMINEQHRSSDRVEIVKKIEDFERRGNFFEDVENDPPSKELLPNEIDYYRRNIVQKIQTKFAFMIAHRYVKSLIADKKFILKAIKGIDNFNALSSGAVITCNHFNAADSFAIQMTYESADQPKRKFYRVIREGNYTSFPGFYGFLMRNCNTLPLSSNKETMKKFIKATDQLLKDGHFVLIYPEQAMWWNYRKPRPLKRGAFVFAARNMVPVLPCFITMKDSDIIDQDGFHVQEYTVHVAPAIYPDPSLSERENTKMLMAKNSEIWKEIYETTYGIPLTYTCDQENAEANTDQ